MPDAALAEHYDTDRWQGKSSCGGTTRPH